MKRRMIFIPIFALLLLCVSAFVSCGGDPSAASLLILKESKRAVRLIELSDEKYGNADSYVTQVDISTDIEFVGGSVSLSESVTGTVKDRNSDNPIYHTATDESLTITADDQSTTTNNTSNYGFMNGKLFITSGEGEDKFTRWMYMTASEYISFMNTLNGDERTELIIDTDAFSICTAERNEDDTWTVCFGDPDADALRSYEKMFGNIGEIGGVAYKLASIDIEAVISEDYYPQAYSITLEYNDENDINPIYVDMEAKFRDFNNVSAPTDIEEDPKSQTRDLRPVFMLEDKISDLAVADIAEFVLKRSNSEVSKVSVNGANGKFSYDVKTGYSDNGEYEKNITYQDGIVTTKVIDRFDVDENGERVPIYSTETEECTEAEARSYISGLIMPTQLSFAQITDYERPITEDGSYTLTLAPESVSMYLSTLDVSVSGSSKITFTFAVKDGEIEWYSFRMTIKVNDYSVSSQFYEYSEIEIG